MSRAHRLPVIDLDRVGEESQLLPLITSILRDHDTFLLANYANSGVLAALLGELRQCPPDRSQGFDANFTGTLPLSHNDGSESDSPEQREASPGDSATTLLEQYIYNSGDALQFDRECANTVLQRLYARLLKVAQYFAQLCLAALGVPREQIDCAADYGAKLTRYYTPLAAPLPTNEEDDPLGLYAQTAAAAADGAGDYAVHRNAGLLAVYPSAAGIRYKPSAVASDDNRWCAAWETGDPDGGNEKAGSVLVVHVGEMLARLSGGRVASRPLQLDTSANIVEVTLYPNLAGPTGPAGSTGSTGNVASMLLDQQILEFPQVAKRFYRQQWCTLRLRDRVAFYQRLFAAGETVLSLYSISRGASAVAPRLAALLPQLSNMVKRGVSQDDFLRMVTLWPEAYVLSADKERELTVQLPKRDALAALTARSRKLDFCEHAEQWLAQCLQQAGPGAVPEDVPVFRLANKRRGSSSDEQSSSLPSTSSSPEPQHHKHAAARRNYLSNNRDPAAVQAPRKVQSQGDLLERLKEKERRSATLLQDRQRKHDQFLAIKMKQVFNIIFSLKWGQPYTITQLRSIIVDTLQDSNNPIGPEEAEEVVLRLQGLLGGNCMTVAEVDGGLKVFRWDNLDKEQFAALLESRLQAHAL